MMKIYDMDKKCYIDIAKFDNPETKIQQLSDALYHYKNNIFKLIYDKSQPALRQYISSLDKKTLEQKDAQWLFFTSGTTGTPTGVFKTKQNSLQQAQTLIRELKDKKFNRVVTTVPFVHIYGIDIGGVLPFEMDIDVWTKENFLPQELAQEATKDGTLIVTTPVFIKALNKLKREMDLSGSFFLTSTAPLMPQDAKEFKEHYKASVMQLFASTETGLISHKTDDENILKCFDIVEIGKNDDRLHVNSPLVTKKIIHEGKQTDVVLPFQTEDIVEILSKDSFRLLGRSQNLIKVSGKRISTVQIENILESIDFIEAVLIRVKRDEKALKDEILDIYVQSKQELKGKMVREMLKQHFGSMHIPFSIHNNKKILRSSVGKKIGFE